MAYSDVTDLLLGDIRTDGVINSTAFVQAASDEIDSVLGQRYVTPIALDDTAVNRPSKLLLKIIANNIATGQIILTISRSGEDATLDALGRYYVNLGRKALSDLADPGYELVGAVYLESHSGPTNLGPRVDNDDAQSLVDMFYADANPSNAGFWNPYPRVPRPGNTF